MYEKVDYGYVINRLLLRIAEVKGDLLKPRPDVVVGDSSLRNVADYLYHVEALHTILIPELRGASTKYLDVASRLLTLLNDLQECKDDKDRVRELERKASELLEELPKDLAEKVASQRYYHKMVSLIIDKALEEMLQRLYESGLLIKGKHYRVGY